MVVVSLVLLLLGSVFSLPFGLLTKYVVDIIALGYSMSKTVLLLGFGLVLALLVERPLPLKVTWQFPLALALMMLFNLTQFLWYCHRFQLHPPDWTAMVRNGLWSMSRLDHFHTSKAMLSSLPTSLAYKTDVGYAFGAVFPNWLLLGQFACFGGLVVLCVLACLQVLKSRPKGESISFVLASFVLIKCAVDGGPLVPEFWVALPFVCAVNWGRKGLAWSAGGTLIYTISLFFWKWRAPFVLLYGILPSLLLIGAPWLSQKHRRAAAGCLLLALLSPLARWWLDPISRIQPFALNTMVYAGSRLESGWLIHVVSPREIVLADRAQADVVEQLYDPSSGHFFVELALKKTTNPYTLCRDLGLELSRKPLSWYNGRVVVTSDVLFLQGQLDEVLASPLVLSSKVESSGRYTRLTLEMRPGVNRDLGISVLGPKLSVVRNFQMSYPVSD